MYLLTDTGALINMDQVNAVVVQRMNKIEIQDYNRGYQVTALFDEGRISLIESLDKCEAKAVVEEIAESYISNEGKSVVDLDVIRQMVTA